MVRPPPPRPGRPSGPGADGEWGGEGGKGEREGERGGGGRRGGGGGRGHRAGRSGALGRREDRRGTRQVREGRLVSTSCLRSQGGESRECGWWLYAWGSVCVRVVSRCGCAMCLFCCGVSVGEVCVCGVCMGLRTGCLSATCVRLECVCAGECPRGSRRRGCKPQ